MFCILVYKSNGPPTVFLFLLRDLPLKCDRLVRPMRRRAAVSGDAATDRNVDFGAVTDDWTLKLSPTRQKLDIRHFNPWAKAHGTVRLIFTVLHRQLHRQKCAPLFSELLCPCPEPAPEALEIRRGQNIRVHPTKCWSRLKLQKVKVNSSIIGCLFALRTTSDNHTLWQHCLL